MEKGSRREGKTAWEIAEFYTVAFKNDLLQLNILEPDIWVKATDTIAEQIALIETLEEKEYTYRTGDGIYFDTSKFKDYTKLSHQDIDSLPGRQFAAAVLPLDVLDATGQQFKPRRSCQPLLEPMDGGGGEQGRQ